MIMIEIQIILIACFFIVFCKITIQSGLNRYTYSGYDDPNSFFLAKA